MRYLTLSTILFCACAGFGRQNARPIDRLCENNPSCRDQVLHIEDHTFQGIEDVVVFGLAYLHEKYPGAEMGGAVYKNPDGSYYFQLAGAGNGDQVDLTLHPGVRAWFHTHTLGGGRSCSRQDQESTLEVQFLLKRKDVRSFVQSPEGPVLECMAHYYPYLARKRR